MSVRNIVKLNTFQEFKNEYGSTPVTMEFLASYLGVAYKTVRNRKKDLEQAGIVFVRKNKAKAKVEDKTSETLRALINCLLEAKGLPPYFALDYKVRLSRVKALEAFNSIFSKEDLALDSDEVKAATTTHLQYKHQEIRPFVPEEDKILLTEIFKDLFNLEPTTEQFKTIYTSYVFLSQRRLGSVPGVIQADAGSSKTTCMKALQRFMEKKGLPAPVLVSKTNKALEDIDYGQTYASFVGEEYQGLNLVKHSQTTLDVLSIMNVQEKSEKIPYIIVDEFSLLSPAEIRTLHTLADKILFVGDINQLGEINVYPGSVISTLKTQYRFLGSLTDHQVNISTLLREKKEKDLLLYVKNHSLGTFDCFLDFKESKEEGFKPFCNYKDSFLGYLPLLEEYKGDDAQVIAFSLDAVHNLNVLMNGSPDILVGSKVRLTKKDHRQVNAIPGTYWTVLAIKDKVCTCFNKTRGTIEVPVGFLTLGYATTSWVSQGSAWDKVLGIMGTAYTKMKLKDISTIATRCKKELKFLTRGEIDVTAKDIFSFFSSSKGNRYNSSAFSIRAMIKYMTDAKEFEFPEILKAIQYGASMAGQELHVDSKGNYELKAKKEKASSPVKEEVAKPIYEFVEPTYGYVKVTEEGDKIYPTTEQRFKSEKQVNLILDKKHLKGEKVIKAMLLQGTRYVVLDTDTEEKTRKYAELLADKTEAWVAEDLSSGHFVFTVDKLYKSTIQAKDAGMDFLGNDTVNQLRQFKNNKKSNGLNPIDLSKDLQDVIEKDLGVTLKVRPLDSK